MAKSKSMTFIMILLTLILAGAVIGFRFFVHFRADSHPVSDNFNPNPEKVYPDLDSGPVPGTEVLRIDNVIIKGNKTNLNLNSIRKPKMLIFMPGGNTCRKCVQASLEAINFLKEQLKEDVAVYLLYTDKAYFPEYSTLTPDPNIIIVENAASFLRELKSLSPRIFFVDKDSSIRYFMNLPQDPPGWREANQKIIRFVQTGEIPDMEKPSSSPIFK